jgi:uncharacterized protein
MKWGKRFAIIATVAIVLIWILLPTFRALALTINTSLRSVKPHRELPLEPIQFKATDGVSLHGWILLSSPKASTIILVHGFKGNREDMLPWARYLYAAHYNVLLYDSRGCGESEGNAIALGAHEDRDVLGAIRYLDHRNDITEKSYGALGMSLGAGIVILAGAESSELKAIIADSAWADEQPQIERMHSISLGRFSIPLLPYEEGIVNHLIDADLASVRPVDVAKKISPRALMLIHSADDHNALTPLSGAQQIYANAGEPRDLWIAPSGGHVGAIHAHPDEYQQRTLQFLGKYLITSGNA